MSFCDFVPDDPSCAPEPVPEPEPVVPEPVDPVDPVDPVVPEEPVDPVDPVEPKPEAGGDGEMAEGDDPMAMHGMMGNLAFLGVAAAHVAYPLLDMLRYSEDSEAMDTLADSGLDGGSTNFYSLGKMIGTYGMLAAGSVLSLTQLLSMFGVTVETNVMLWEVVHTWVAPILFGIVGILHFLAYDTAYTNCHDNTFANQADACSLQSAIETEMLEHSVMELSFGATMMEAYEGWMHAQFMAAPAETQKAWMEAHMAEEMGKKMWMEAKAKELGIDHGKGEKESEWSMSSGDDM